MYLEIPRLDWSINFKKVAPAVSQLKCLGTRDEIILLSTFWYEDTKCHASLIQWCLPCRSPFGSHSRGCCTVSGRRPAAGWCRWRWTRSPCVPRGSRSWTASAAPLAACPGTQCTSPEQKQKTIVQCFAFTFRYAYISVSIWCLSDPNGEAHGHSHGKSMVVGFRSIQ